MSETIDSIDEAIARAIATTEYGEHQLETLYPGNSDTWLKFARAARAAYEAALAETGMVIVPREAAVSFLRHSGLHDTDKWQPIETAPKGQEVLIYGTVENKPRDPVVAIAEFDEDQWLLMSCGEFVNRGEYFSLVTAYPTHWQQIPKPPKS